MSQTKAVPHSVSKKPYTIVALNQQHKRKLFDCGQNDLNRYLQQTAKQHQQKYISKTYVIVATEQPQTVLGFYTMTLSEIAFDKFNQTDNKKLPKAPLPVARLSRLAINKEQQGKGVGRLLLVDAIFKTVRLLDSFAVVALVLDAKDKKVAGYYQKFGFIESQDQPLMLYLPVKSLKEMA